MDSYTLNCEIILAGQQLPAKFMICFNSLRLRIFFEFCILYLLLLMNNSPPNSTTTFRRVISIQDCSSIALNHYSTVTL